MFSLHLYLKSLYKIILSFICFFLKESIQFSILFLFRHIFAAHHLKVQTTCPAYEAVSNNQNKFFRIVA